MYLMSFQMNYQNFSNPFLIIEMHNTGHAIQYKTYLLG